jgi:hypothetical protein
MQTMRALERKVEELTESRLAAVKVRCSTASLCG